MNVRKSILSVSVVAALGALVVQSFAGGDKVEFPEGFEKGTLYATVDRYDIKQFRELYASPGVVEAVRKGGAIPNGAVLTLVQYRAKTDDKGNPVRGPPTATFSRTLWWPTPWWKNALVGARNILPN